MPFTDLQIQRLKPKATAYDLTETGVAPHQRGLQVRVHPSGVRTWLYRYTVNGKTERVRLGNWPKMKLAGAHRALMNQRDLRDKLKADNLTPATFRKAEAAAKEAAALNTVNALADEFINRELRQFRKDATGHWAPYSPPRPVKRESWAEVQRILEKDVLPILGKRAMHTISPKEIGDLLDGISDRGASIMANRVHAVLKQMFRFAVGKGWIEAVQNPCRDIAKPLPKEPSRDRVLTDDEIRSFWRALDVAKMLPRMRHIYRLILTTAQRPGEVTRAKWDEFDLKNATWTIPAARTKTRKADHDVPLSSLALEILRDLRADLDDGEQWLFPGQRLNQSGPIEDKAAAHALRNNREFFEIPAFTPHDLRRSARTGLAAIGVDSITAKKILNHALEGMDAVYDRHSYTEQKVAAMQLWADHLGAVVAGKKSKVTPIDKKKRTARRAS